MVSHGTVEHGQRRQKERVRVVANLGSLKMVKKKRDGSFYGHTSLLILALYNKPVSLSVFFKRLRYPTKRSMTKIGDLKNVSSVFS